MDFFLLFLLVSFGIGFLHKVRYQWRFLLILTIAIALSFIYLFFRQI